MTLIFEVPSDEEVYHEEEELDDDGEEDEGESEHGLEEEVRLPRRHKSQSAWDFASYSASAADEHARRKTTSVDDKILKVLGQRSIPITHSDDDDSAELQPNKQVKSFPSPLPIRLSLGGLYKLQCLCDM